MRLAFARKVQSDARAERGGRGRCVGLMGFVAHVAFMSFAFNLIAFLWVRHKIRQHRKEPRERERARD